MALFLAFAITGRRVWGGEQTSLPLLDLSTLQSDWNATNGIPTGPGQPFGQIGTLVMDAYGSLTNLLNFVPLRSDINGIKGAIMGLAPALGLDSWEKRVKDAKSGNTNAYNSMFRTLHEVRRCFPASRRRL